MNLKKLFVKRLRSEMDRQEITALKLSALAKLNRSTITRIMSGKVEVSVTSLEKISGALKIPPGQLLESPEKVVLRKKTVRASV